MIVSPLPTEAALLMAALAPAFTTPRFRHIRLLLVAAILAPGRRTIANLVRTVGALAAAHRTTYQRVLSSASWSGLHLGCLLGNFVLHRLVPADSNTLLVLNAALANGRMALSNRPENPVANKHPDFVCIAAANTFGTGADWQYVGRSQLDESTLDRFRIGQIEMDYDAEVEATLCPDDALRTRLQGYRQAVQRNRMRRVVSSRFLRDAYVMKQAGDTDAEIDAALFAGWSADEVRKMEVQS